MKWPKISIVTPSYNQGEFLEQTIKSILNQNYPNLEIIVQDGGSSDKTLAILKKYRGKIKFESKKDRGQTHALNQGFKKATGEIFGYLNSDDLFLPEALRQVAQYFNNNPRTQWLTGQCDIIDAQGRPIRSLVKRYKDWWLRHYSYQNLLMLNFVSQPATFWRRKSMETIGPLDDTLNYVMDYDYWLRLGKQSAPGLIHHPLAAFRMHRGSKTMRGFGAQLYEQYKVAKRYTENPIILGLHRIHGLAINLVYSIIQ